MEEVFTRLEQLAGHVKEYINNRLDAAKLNVAEKTSKSTATVLAFMGVLVFLFLFIIFTGIAIAYALSEWTGKLYWGFLIVAGLYLAGGIIIWVARARLIQMPVMNAILRQLSPEKENNTHEEDQK